MRTHEIITEDMHLQQYVYHASYLPDLRRGLASILKHGLLPSRSGYYGPGVYFAYTPEGGLYHVGPEATMFRVRWIHLVKLFGVYPGNPNGIQRDEEQIVVPRTVPAQYLEVEYFKDEWWDIPSALAAERGWSNLRSALAAKPGPY